jgi:hypothetical protein
MVTSETSLVEASASVCFGACVQMIAPCLSCAGPSRHGAHNPRILRQALGSLFNLCCRFCKHRCCIFSCKVRHEICALLLRTMTSGGNDWLDSMQHSHRFHTSAVTYTHS